SGGARLPEIAQPSARAKRGAGFALILASRANVECGGLFTLLAPILEGSFEGPPLLRLQASPTNFIPSPPAFPEARFCCSARRVRASPARRLLAETCGSSLSATR